MNFCTITSYTFAQIGLGIKFKLEGPELINVERIDSIRPRKEKTSSGKPLYNVYMHAQLHTITDEEGYNRIVDVINKQR